MRLSLVGTIRISDTHPLASRAIDHRRGGARSGADYWQSESSGAKIHV